jgi:hypothetical protein
MTRDQKIEALAEEWISVPSYEGLYDVSNLGRVRSLRFRRKFADTLRENPLIMKGSINSNGYAQVQLSNDSGKKTVLVQKLVLTAFVGPRPSGYEAAHLDGNRVNNHLSNLKWCTKKENVSHLKKHGTVLYGAKNPMTRLTEKQVIDIRKTYSVGNCSIKKLAKKYGVGTSTVWRIVSGKYWRHLNNEQFMKTLKGDGDVL